MLLAIQIIFWLGVVAYVTGAVAAMGFLYTRHRPLILFAGKAAWAGAIALFLCFFARLAHYQLPPLTTVSDNLNLFIFAATAIMLLVLRHEERRGLLVFYSPALAAMALVSGYFATRDLATPPRPLTTMLLVPHVGLAYVAYAMSFVVMLTAIAYIYQVHRLKNRQALGLVQRLPSLEQLDRVLYLLVAWGYAVFIGAFAAGLFWAWYENELLSPYWWIAPKVVLSIAMIALYAACFHARARGWLRGPKLANLMMLGFGSVLGLYLVLELLHKTNYNFFQVGAG